MRLDDEERLYKAKQVLGANLLSRRKELGWSMKEAAYQLEMHESTYRDYEVVKRDQTPKLHTLIKFCQVFNCTLTELTDGIDEHYDGTGRRYPGPEFGDYSHSPKASRPRS